jgi:hypothetical protein
MSRRPSLEGSGRDALPRDPGVHVSKRFFGCCHPASAPRESSCSRFLDAPTRIARARVPTGALQRRPAMAISVFFLLESLSLSIKLKKMEILGNGPALGVVSGAVCRCPPII